jgi:O-antigen ligase
MLAFGLTINKSYQALSPPFSKKRVFTFVVLGNALGILFAAERSAWLGVIVALMCSTMLLSFRRTFRMIIVLLAVAALLWCTVPVVQQRLAPLVNWQTDVSVRVRFQLWRESWQIFADKPLFGVGIRNFPHQVIPEALVRGMLLWIMPTVITCIFWRRLG